MGGGDNMSNTTTKTEQKKNHLQRVQCLKPPFTIGDIKKAIPPHCFQRSLLRSLSYLARDLIFVCIFYYIATTYFDVLPSPYYYYYLAWSIYWIVQGCVCTGIWVIAHECGHHAFSDYPWINDTVGFILHSALLTPYFSWKYSHRRHHSNTNSLEHDENHVPNLKSQLRWYTKLYTNNSLGRLFILAFTLIAGLPLYFAINIAGRRYDRFASHYDPYSPIYNDHERLQIYIPDAGVIATAYVLYRVALEQGLAWIVCIYGVPLLIVNGFIVLITFLHHTHPSLPHYDKSEWDWLRGALATVDRDYGVLTKVFHNITDTHVVHHLFSTMPHYHAMEATKVVKPLLGEYYQFDGTPIYQAMWRDLKECIYVEKEEESLNKGVYWRTKIGASGNLSSPTTIIEQKKNPLQRVPCSKPPFTVGDIKKAIPPHCFQRSLIRSFSYLVQDLILISFFYYIATTYFHLLPPPYSYLAWPAYWIVQGCVCTGIWVIGHECGHQGFSEYQWVDDTVGLILHSALLTPYFSWKHSHCRHHSNTGSLENNEVYIPRLKSKLRWYYKYLNNPLGRVLVLAFTLTFGWPLYLLCNVSGRNYDRFACHYDPYSPIYSDRERLQIYISDVSVIATIYASYHVALTKGLAWLVCIYWVPLLIVNGFIVLITLLHHTHSSLPHYDSSEWHYLKGALATVDRDYGVLNKVFHNATDTHVLHHIFPNISHYHAMEATKAIKPLLGEYYQLDDTPIFKALWRDTKECIYVEKDEGSLNKGVYWYKNKL